MIIAPRHRALRAVALGLWLALFTPVAGYAASGGGAAPGATAGLLAPAVLGLPAPQPEPSLPDGIDRFEPPDLPVQDGAPTIAEFLRSAGPDDSVTMTGLGLAAGQTTFDIFAETAGHPGAMTAAPPVGVAEDAAVLLLPKDLPPWSAYLVWPRNGAARGRPVLVNHTDAWWIAPRTAPAGAVVSVYGRNLAYRNGTGTAFVYLKPAGKEGRWLTPTAVNPYKVDFAAPELEPGAYEVWLHNGHGGRFGWSGPLALTIAPPPLAQARPTIDVRRFGARGDGVSDDGPAITEALAAASAQAPATLYFPAGTYAVRRAFTVPSHVRWLGDGRDESRLVLALDTTALGAAGFLTGGNGLEDVTFEAIGIAADRMIDRSPDAMLLFGGRDIRFVRARLSSWGAKTFETTTAGLTFDDVDITGSGLFLASSSQVLVRASTFRMTNDGEAALTSWGGRDIAVIGTRLLNADESRADGHGIGRLFVSQGHFGSTSNMYFAENVTVNAAPRDCGAVDCNKGEQILFEYGSVRLRGRASAVAADRVAFPAVDLPDLAGGRHLMIVGGRGVGQTRRIVAVDGDTVVLDRPFAVMPDTTTSLFFIDAIADRAVVYRNTFQGRASFGQHDSNSTATLVWGNCRDIVVAENTISRMRHGIMVASTSGKITDSVSAPAFVLVEGNTIGDGNNGLYTGLTFGYDTYPSVRGGVGNILRRNTIAGMSHIGIAVDTWNSLGGDILATVFEHNRLTDIRYGLVSALQTIWAYDQFVPTPARGTRLRLTFLYDNAFTAPRGDPLSLGFRSDAGQEWLARDNSFSGFARSGRGP